MILSVGLRGSCNSFDLKFTLVRNKTCDYLISFDVSGKHVKMSRPKITEIHLSLYQVGGRAVTGNTTDVKRWLLVLVTHILALS